MALEALGTQSCVWEPWQSTMVLPSHIVRHFPLGSLLASGTGQQLPRSSWSWSLQVFTWPSGAGHVLLAPVPLLWVWSARGPPERGEKALWLLESLGLVTKLV